MVHQGLGRSGLLSDILFDNLSDLIGREEDIRLRLIVRVFVFKAIIHVVDQATGDVVEDFDGATVQSHEGSAREQTLPCLMEEISEGLQLDVIEFVILFLMLRGNEGWEVRHRG
jgi:hypothetical protein